MIIVVFLTYEHVNNVVLCQLRDVTNPPKQNCPQTKTVDSPSPQKRSLYLLNKR